MFFLFGSLPTNKGIFIKSQWKVSWFQTAVVCLRGCELFRLGVEQKANVKLTDLQTCADGTKKYDLHSSGAGVDSDGSGSLGKLQNFFL